MESKSASSPSSAGLINNGGGSSSSSSSSQRPLRLRRVNHSDEVVSGFAKLLKSESLSDVTLISAGGQAIRAHKVILSMFSPYFRSIFEAQPFANNPNNFPVIVMKDMGMQELKTIVEFIYKGEASVPREKLHSILQAAKSLEVSGLSDVKELASGSSASPTSSSESNPSPRANNSCSPGPVGGNYGLNLSASAAFKRGGPDLEPTTIYGGTGPDPQLKKLRITLDNGNDLAHSVDIGSGFVSTNFGTAAGGGGVDSIDGVRSLLQQPPRLPHAFQQIRQQQQLQQFQQHLNMQKQQQRQLTSLQQLVQQRQLQQRQQQRQQQALQHQMNRQILQQQLIRGSSKQFPIIKGSQGAQLIQFQNRIKAQLQDSRQPRLSGSFAQGSSTLQERLLQKPVSHNKSKSPDKIKDHLDVKREPVDEERDQSNDVGSSDERCTTAGSNSEKGTPSKESGDGNSSNNGAENGDETNTETDASNSALNEIKNTSKDDTNNNNNNNGSGAENDGEEPRGGQEPEGSNSSRSGSGNGGSGKCSGEEKHRGDIEEEDAASQTMASGGVDDGVEYLEDEEEPLQPVENDEDEEYEVDIDKDLIFQRQQQLRLQQLQKQQQYQQQLQMQQEEQEQRLMEFHQQLQQANESNAGNEEADDNGTGFGFDWQEGFIDDGFTPTSESSQDHPPPLAIMPATPMTIHATPDFLQPRGPGRPRKGNKSSEISPCPECNKVFVRPDVLKLHYRSVHLNERHPCNLCPKIFKWPGDLSKHKRTKHPDLHNQASLQSSQIQST